MSFFIDRLKEPSTAAGIAIAAQAAATSGLPWWQALLFGIGGVIAVVAPEKGERK